MKCERTRQKLSAYMDGELDAGLHRTIESHLEQCPGCRKELEALGGVDLLIRELPRYSPSPNFAEVVAARARETIAPEKRPHLIHHAWAALLTYSERFLDLLEPEGGRRARSLEEFNDIPASFIGHAYFRALGAER